MIKRFFKNHPIHKKIVPLFDLFFFMSPMNSFLSSAIICIGMYLALFMANSSPLFVNNFSYKAVCLFIGIQSILFGNHINASRNSITRFSVLIRKFKVKYSTTYINNIIRVLYLLGIVCLANINIIILFIGLLLIAINILIYKSYNKFLDKNPYLTFMYQSLVDLLLLICGFIFIELDSIYGINFILLFLPYFLLYISLFLAKDSLGFIIEEKLINFGSILKPSKLIFISLCLLVIAFGFAILIKDPLSSIIIIISIPFFIYASIRGMKKDFQRALVYPVGIINFFIITIFPYLFIPTFILFYISKYYNWHRLDYHYPTFLVEDD
jgi:hypothetical protein